MGLVNVVFATLDRSGQPAYNGGSIASEDLTSAAGAVETSAAATNCVARITTDTAIYAAVGPAVTAAAGDWYILSGTTLDLVVNAGDVVSVIDA